MKVLITGANGTVAKAAIKHCQNIGDEVFAYTREDLDIADKEKVFEILEKDKPEAVINCAAYTDVDGAETNQEICYKANVSGVENLALVAKEINSAFVTVSTDYVFDGTKGDFYTQKDTPNPLGFYAETKYQGEKVAKNHYARSVIVRTGWIYGNGGTNFLSVMDKLLADGKNIKAISDSYGTPTYANDLAVRLRDLAILDLPNIYHVSNEGEGVSFVGFAQKICEIKGYDSDLIEPVSAETLKRPAPRPIDSRLKCLFSEKFGLEPLQNWETALKKFLNNG
jgi:dTDP-4-dehydrorhamnose reductase